jgi:hypothetical protein
MVRPDGFEPPTLGSKYQHSQGGSGLGESLRSRIDQ